MKRIDSVGRRRIERQMIEVFRFSGAPGNLHLQISLRRQNHASASHRQRSLGERQDIRLLFEANRRPGTCQDVRLQVWSDTQYGQRKPRLAKDCLVPSDR